MDALIGLYLLFGLAATVLEYKLLNTEVEEIEVSNPRAGMKLGILNGLHLSVHLVRMFIVWPLYWAEEALILLMNDLEGE